MKPTNRDYEITAARQSGESLSSIAHRYELTRQRVDVIVKDVKKNAKRLLIEAVRSNLLYRPDTCEECGVQCTPDGHHEDYSKPLAVMWLCKRCHSGKHKDFRPDIEDRKPQLQTVEVKILVSPGLRGRIETARGLIPVSAWVRNIIEEKINQQESGG